MLRQAPLVRQVSTCRASVPPTSRKLVRCRPTHCTAVSRQQVMVQCMHTGQHRAKGNPGNPPSLPAQHNQGSPQALVTHTATGAPSQAPPNTSTTATTITTGQSTASAPGGGQGPPTATSGTSWNPKQPQIMPANQKVGVPPVPAGQPRAQAAAKAHADAKQWSSPSLTVCALGSLPLAAMMYNDFTALTFLRFFPVFLHNRSLSECAVPQDGTAQLELACIVADAHVRDPTGGKDASWDRLPLCSAPYTANYYVGAAKSMRWNRGDLGFESFQRSKAYSWTTVTSFQGRYLPPGADITDQDLDDPKVTTLVLKAYELDKPANQHDGRVAFIPCSNTTVVCWGQVSPGGKLLVSVLQAATRDMAWKIEDVILTKPKVVLQCGQDQAVLDKVTCVLGPRSYVAAQPPSSSAKTSEFERLTVVGAWCGGLSPGWRLFAQIKHYTQTGTLFGESKWQDMRNASNQDIVLVGASQLFPLGPNAYVTPAKTRLEALEVPAGRESYINDDATSISSSGRSDFFTGLKYRRFEVFDTALNAYTDQHNLSIQQMTILWRETFFDNADKGAA